MQNNKLEREAKNRAVWEKYNKAVKARIVLYCHRRRRLSSSKFVHWHQCLSRFWKHLCNSHFL